MRSRPLLSILLTLASVSAAAKERISILDFVRSDPVIRKLVTESEIQYLTQQMRDVATNMVDPSRYEVMTRENILVMLPPGKKNLSECEGQCEVETARNLGSRWHVVGDVRKVGSQLALSVRLYDVVGGAQLGGVRVIGPDVDALVNGVEPKGKELFSRIPALATSQAAPPPAAAPPAPASSTKSGGSGSPKPGMVAIPAGCFMMGSNDGKADERPVHQVCLSAFSMDRYNVTNALYSQAGFRAHYEDSSCYAWGFLTSKFPGRFFQRVVPDRFRGSSQPVVCVEWSEAKRYCESQGKRLPTEAEYEYATRAGTSTQYFWGNDSNEGCRYANGADQTLLSNGSSWKTKMECKDGYGDVTSPVGSFQPNPWGLYDMTGNVGSWTSDWYDSTYNASSPQRNPTGPGSGSNRVHRGGSWLVIPTLLRSADRVHQPPSGRGEHLGFRCVSP